MLVATDSETFDPLDIVGEFGSPAPRPTLAGLGLGRAVGYAAMALVLAAGLPTHALAQNAQYQAAPYQGPPAYPQAPAYPPPPGYPPPPAYAEPPAPPPPPGAVWVGAPGQCLYGNGMVYWCAPGVVFDGFPPDWDFAAFPVFSFGPGIVVDPFWFNGWRVGHPGFAFRGRFATEAERRDFAAHRGEIIRNGAVHAHDTPAPRPRQPEERR